MPDISDLYGFPSLEFHSQGGDRTSSLALLQDSFLAGQSNDSTNNLPSSSQNVTNEARQEIQTLLTRRDSQQPGLESNRFHMRQQAIGRLENYGLTVVPFLVRHLGQPNLSIDTVASCSSSIDNILADVATQDLLSFRDPASRNQFLERTLGSAPDDQLSNRFMARIDRAIQGRLSPTDWQRPLALIENPRTNMAGMLSCSQHSINHLDSLNTQGGQLQVQNRTEELTTLFGNPHLTNDERLAIGRQLSQLGHLASPTFIQNQQVTMRLQYSDSFDQSHPQRERLLLEAQRIGGSTHASQIALQVVLSNLDQNERFMQDFYRSGGNSQQINHLRELANSGQLRLVD